MRPPVQLTEEEFNALLLDQDAEPETERRPSLAVWWASVMNDVPEIQKTDFKKFAKSS